MLRKEDCHVIEASLGNIVSSRPCKLLSEIVYLKKKSDTKLGKAKSEIRTLNDDLNSKDSKLRTTIKVVKLNLIPPELERHQKIKMRWGLILIVMVVWMRMASP